MKVQTNARRFVVRHLRKGDTLSAELLGKWDVLHLDGEWVWVVEHRGKLDAILIAAPMHGLLFLLRIAGTKKAPHGWLLTTLRRALRESRDRGMLAVMTYVTATEKELKLVRLATREGWLGAAETGMWLMGPCEARH